jgi:hypothetical protein
MVIEVIVSVSLSLPAFAGAGGTKNHPQEMRGILVPRLHASQAGYFFFLHIL